MDSLSTANVDLMTAATEALEVVTRQRQAEFDFHRKAAEEQAARMAQVIQSQVEMRASEQQFHSVLDRDLGEVMGNMGLDRQAAIDYLRRSLGASSSS